MTEPALRPTVPDLDALLGHSFPVLDSGFVRAVDYMGGDDAVVQAARVSYGQGTKKVREDRALIRYLLRHRHTTPFEMCELKLHVRVPMDCWRQWIRHRTANVNEYSTRYSVAVDAAQHTNADEWRSQSNANKQGSGLYLPMSQGIALTERERVFQEDARKVYEERLAAGVAREQARKDLPLSTYTEAYWKVDLHNLLHFLALRMDSRAQLEIRSYATTIGHEIVRRWCPLVWEAFEDFRLSATSFSSAELRLLESIISGSPQVTIELATQLGLLTDAGPTRELEELEPKLHRLGLAPPWNRTSLKPDL